MPQKLWYLLGALFLGLFSWPILTTYNLSFNRLKLYPKSIEVSSTLTHQTLFLGLTSFIHLFIYLFMCSVMLASLVWVQNEEVRSLLHRSFLV